MKPCAVDEKRWSADGGPLRPGGLGITDRGLGFYFVSHRSRILDAGCGEGSALKHLSDHYTGRACGVDISGPILRKARTECGSLPLAQGTIESLPFRDGTFDGIICECVLSLTSVLGPLREFGRLIREGGFLVVSDLYQRVPGEAGTEAPAGAGLPGEDRIKRLLGALDFRVVHWEDRTGDLRKFAAQLVMEGVACDHMLPDYFTTSPARPDRWSGVGYYLAVAEKQTGRMGGENDSAG